jgi:hypothetical protein
MPAGSPQLFPDLVKSRIATPSITMASSATTPRESAAMAAALRSWALGSPASP